MFVYSEGAALLSNYTYHHHKADLFQVRNHFCDVVKVDQFPEPGTVCVSGHVYDSTFVVDREEVGLLSYGLQRGGD